MQDNISPEERLLRLIRQGQRKSSKKPEKNKKIQALPRQINWSKIFSFELVGRVLFATFLVLSSYLLVDFALTSPGKIEEKALTLNQAKGSSLEVAFEAAGKPEPLSFYSKPASSKNIFTAAQKEVKVASPSFMEMVSKLRLQGVIAAPDPQAVIEDTRTRQTYFLFPGEYIGEIELKTILPGKVILNYYGEEAELPL